MTSGTSGAANKTEGRTSSDPHALCKDVGVVALILLMGVVGTTVAWALGGADWFTDDGLSTIGWVGAFVSLVGVIVAVLIFRRQTRAAVVAADDQSELLDKIRATLGEVHTKVSDLQRASESLPDDDESTDDEVDQWAEDTPDAQPHTVYATSPTGRKRRVFEPSQVPLAVIAALVSSWKSSGLTGKWTLGMLRGALRTEGKGNHPWFLIFEPRDGESTAWKVSRGPGGSDHAVEIKSPRDLN